MEAGGSGAPPGAAAAPAGPLATAHFLAWAKENFPGALPEVAQLAADVFSATAPIALAV